MSSASRIAQFKAKVKRCPVTAVEEGEEEEKGEKEETEEGPLKKGKECSSPPSCGATAPRVMSSSSKKVKETSRERAASVSGKPTASPRETAGGTGKRRTHRVTEDEEAVRLAALKKFETPQAPKAGAAEKPKVMRKTVAGTEEFCEEKEVSRGASILAEERRRRVESVLQKVLNQQLKAEGFSKVDDICTRPASDDQKEQAKEPKSEPSRVPSLPNSYGMFNNGKKSVTVEARAPKRPKISLAFDEEDFFDKGKKKIVYELPESGEEKQNDEPTPSKRAKKERKVKLDSPVGARAAGTDTGLTGGNSESVNQRIPVSAESLLEAIRILADDQSRLVVDVMDREESLQSMCKSAMEIVEADISKLEERVKFKAHRRSVCLSDFGTPAKPSPSGKPPPLTMRSPLSSLENEINPISTGRSMSPRWLTGDVVPAPMRSPRPLLGAMHEMNFSSSADREDSHHRFKASPKLL